MSEESLPLRQWPAGIRQASVPANENALRVQALLSRALSVENDAPGTEYNGAVYIVGSAPTGAFSTFSEHDIALFEFGSWYAWAPPLDTSMVVNDVRKVFDGAEWVDDQSIGSGWGDTDDVPEGSSNLYFTAARVLGTILAGLSTATNAAITAADSVLSAFGKLQAQITALAGSVGGLIVQTITNGDTTHAPSGDAVFDALALKFDKAGGEISGPSSIGTPTAELGYSPVFQIEPNGSSLSAVSLIRYGGPGFLAGVRADGVKGAPSAVGAGQGLFELRATGHNGTDFAPSQAASITLLSAEAFTPTANGTSFAVRLCKVGETASANRFRIDGDGTTYPAVNAEADLGKSGNQWKDAYVSGGYYRGGLQVVGARNTGWSAPTGTATKTAFNTATVTTAQLAERVKALTDALIAHGLIGT